MMSAIALTAMLFPVPLSPRRITPPTAGSTAFTRSERFIASCPVMHTNGKGGFLYLSATPTAVR